jgi:hypothetical protein
MKEFLRIVMIIGFVGLGFVFGVVLWVFGSGQFLTVGQEGSLYLWSGISAVIGGFIGYRVSRSISARIMVIICFVGFSIAVGAVLWAMSFSGLFLMV